MKKILKEYLRFHLGCSYITPNSQAQLNDYTLPHAWQMCEDGKKVQLLLRPLASMDQWEMKEYNKLYTTLFDMADGVNQIMQQAACVKFLLSRNLDLFGLIGAGLAIDSTQFFKPF